MTVGLWGKGVRLRRKVAGSEIASLSRNVARTGDFIISKIDARNGAYGFIPPHLDGGVVTNDFPLFSVVEGRADPRWIYWTSRSRFFIDLCRASSEGTTNRVRLKESKFAQVRIPLPPRAEQRRLAAHLDVIESRLTRAHVLREEQEQELQAALRSAFHRLEAHAEWKPMSTVAPLVRREVEVDPDRSYPELGIRSFGRGTFHKPSVLGIDTTKRLFEIHSGDLVFNNVFAWEGAVAVARPEDHGRLGSHRFITCVCDSARVFPQFLHFYFLTRDGLEKLGKASPGGAGRNRTLGIEKLSSITVPLPSVAKQAEFKRLLDLQAKVRAETATASQQTDALLPSLLDRIFSA
ncbi:MAG: restriction endonuclease subunit S [Gemmatimonadales bacterium]|nr:restriction endonuclease subunit S [Gemmatimonadales bacterium]